MARKRVTRWYQVYAERPYKLEPDHWVPWINGDSDRETMRRMVVHKFLRLRGGLAPEVYVYEHEADTPVHPSTGAPLCVTEVVYQVTAAHKKDVVQCD
jgi:hypothetical protein